MKVGIETMANESPGTLIEQSSDMFAISVLNLYYHMSF